MDKEILELIQTTRWFMVELIEWIKIFGFIGIGTLVFWIGKTFWLHK